MLGPEKPQRTSADFVGHLSYSQGRATGLRSFRGCSPVATDTALTVRRLAGPLPAGTTADVLGAVSVALGPIEVPSEGIGAEAALRRLAQVLVEYGLDLAHTRAAAHQPPPLAVAVVADAGKRDQRFARS